jgi:hypothetical protein
MNTTTTINTITTAATSIMEFFTPVSLILLETTKETGKFATYTVEATAGSALQVAVAARMSMQVVKSMAPSTVAEAEMNIMSALAMLDSTPVTDDTVNTDTQEK